MTQTNQQPVNPSTVAPRGDSALESWKEIAAYLNRDERTARRWEKEEELPIHRHHHRARPSVYAYASELDAWLLHDGPRVVAGRQDHLLQTSRHGRGARTQRKPCRV